MSDVKHTPGPWKYAEAVQNNGPNYYAVTTGEWGTPSIADCPKETDARRIAALPDVLDALQALIDHNERTNAAFYVDGTVKAMREAMKGQKQLLIDARAARDKATT